jgi:hypothetical protein
MSKTEITRTDIMDMTAYAAIRKQRRTAMTEKKKYRRLHCGPHATFYFESFETMWHQVHEMLFIEKGGEAQIDDELSAYNPLIPKGRELVATLMFEIDNEEQRSRFLNGLGGVEETAFFDLGGEIIKGVPEEDLDRSTADGKASSVQFLHFPFTPAQIEKFKITDARVMLGIEHAKYAHAVILPETTRAALSADFSD